jgi:hypothetical protein
MSRAPKAGVPLAEPEAAAKRAWLPRMAGVALHWLGRTFYLALFAGMVLILLSG